MPSCPSPFGLKYVLTHDGIDSCGGVLAPLLIVTETAGALHECATPNGSIQLTTATSPLAPSAHWVVSIEPLKPPSDPGLDADEYPPPDSHDTDTPETGNPGAGANDQSALPDNVAPGDGAVSAPGARVSTPSCTDASAVCPLASTACNLTV